MHMPRRPSPRGESRRLRQWVHDRGLASNFTLTIPQWKPAFSAKYAADGSLITGTDKKAGIKSENSIEVEKRKAPKVDVDTAAAVLGDSMPAEEQHETTKEASSDGVSVGAGPYPAAAFEDISLRGETETEVDDGDWEHVDRRLVADNDKNCQTTAKSSVVSAIYGWFSRKG